MFVPKSYGESRTENCPFCGRQAIIKNPQGVPVCNDHKSKDLPDLKCTCGGYLLIQKGKFGPYMNCMKCGNITLKRALEINENLMHAEKAQEKKSDPEYIKRHEPGNMIIRSDDPRFFDD